MRNIYTVNAKQVVVSDSHPEGAYSVVSGYPKPYDSRDYGATPKNPDGSPELALIVAQAEYSATVKNLSLAGNRAMWTVTLERDDGRQIDHRSWGAFPVVTPEPEPEPTPEESEAEQAE